MKQSPLKETDCLLAWFLFFICALVGGAIVGALGGGIIGGILGVSGVEPEVIRTAGGVVGFLLGLPVSYFCFRLMVAKFIVAKLMAGNEAAALPAEPPEP